MNFRALFLLSAAILLLLLSGPVHARGIVDPLNLRIQDAVQSRLRETMPPVRVTVAGVPLHAPSTLPDFYRRRFYAPAWSLGGRPLPEAHALIAEIQQAAAEGLVPSHYHLRAIDDLLTQLAWKPAGGRRPAETLADLDLLLTDAFLTLGSHYLRGRTDPQSIDPEWHLRRRGGDVTAALEKGLRTGRVQAALRELLPVHPGYQELRTALEQYRQVAAAGGWPTIPPGPKLRRGEVDARVGVLRARLSVTGELAAAGGNRFDRELEAAVRRFQSRHGLDPDGVVGRGTLAALNVPAAERARQIEVNLERWRWLPQTVEERFLLVNIADFTLSLVEGGERILDMRVVVGRPYRRTPVFSGRMTYLVLNPQWQVPEKIAVKDILPEVRRDPLYLQKMGFKVLRGWGAETREIDPFSIRWESLDPETLDPETLPFRFRQEPGPKNALGQIKFMLPNDFDVYLHDTPARNLFDKDERTFSSGCIRIEKPLELAEYLLQGTAYGSRQALESALARERNTVVSLPRTLPVHLHYWTAWVDAQGVVQFRPDIYGLDQALRLALDRPPPGQGETIAAPLSTIRRWPGS